MKNKKGNPVAKDIVKYDRYLYIVFLLQIIIFITMNVEYTYDSSYDHFL